MEQTSTPYIIDELVAPDIRFDTPFTSRCSAATMSASSPPFREALPDLNFWGTADLSAEGDYVVGQWEGGGTHTGNVVLDDLPHRLGVSSLGEDHALHRTIVLKIVDELIVEEVGLDDGVKVLQQLGITPNA